MASSANLIDVIIPRILAGFLSPLSALTPILSSCDRRYEPEFKKKGSSVDIPISTEMAVRDVSPSVTSQESPSYQPRIETLRLSQWKEIVFTLDDRECRSIMDGTVTNQMRQNGISMANFVESALAGTYVDFYNSVGTAGTTPFATSADIISSAGEVLDNEYCFENDRALILHTSAHAKAEVLPIFANVNQSGTDVTHRKGYLGEKFGFDVMKGQLVAQHTAGTASGRQVSAAIAAGARTFTLGAAGTGTLVRGDIFRVSGDSGAYVVSSVDGSVISFSPAVRTAWAANAAITVTPSHRANLAIQREAIALVSALTNDPLASEMGIPLQKIVEPNTGLAFTLELERQNYQTALKISTLFGVKAVRPNFGCRLLG
jgi:hypothetical protein